MNSTTINKKQQEVNGDDSAGTPFIAQQHQEKEADLEDESLIEDSEYRNNVEEDDEEDESDTSHGNSGAIEHVPLPRPSIKHPLQHRWTLWYDNPGKRTNSNSWADFLQKVTSFDTVEDFWRVFNNIKPASSLVSGSNYHLFKEGIEPKWEDAQNSKGGRWQVPIGAKVKMMDQMWLYAVLACIGETFECTEDVCGVVVSARKMGDRLCLWTKDIRNEHNILTLGRQLKQFLELPDSVVVGYMSHEETTKPRNTTKNKYEL